MPSASPVLNLVVIRSRDIDRAVVFYQQIGMQFERHAHGDGPEHYASESNGFVFEIYPLRSGDAISVTTRLGFRVADVDRVVSELSSIDAVVVTASADTQWGRRAVVRDFDGYAIELSSEARTT